MKIRCLQESDLVAVQRFTDRTIGQGYYDLAELKQILKRSTQGAQIYSLILIDELGEVRGIRITYAPGEWMTGKGQGLAPHLWKVPQSTCAYFQSLFIEPGLTGQGWGKKLSQEAIRLLRLASTKAVVCHSWKESPGDSSNKYLQTLGFIPIATYPLYWKEVDYSCSRCGKPCVCTAIEMIKYL